jgi:MoaA/NifB/PqqE/SkfB family radical SAM enzyme
MALDLLILYRGPLSSCNYECGYCPFAKHWESPEELEQDRRALERFVEWAAGRRDDRLGVFFTPWGEALIRPWYWEALARLTHLPHVHRAAVQTNLSCRLDWVERCDRRKLALWCTFHPTESTREQFVARCRELDRRGVRYSAGVVGLREHGEEIERLREELSPDVYLWINAYKDQPDYYGEDEMLRLEAIDPLFRLNTVRHASRGRACRAGHTVISVDGEGTIRRCHFIKQPLGNIYEPGFERVLYERDCTNATCGCHIGYVHLNHLELHGVFGDGVLERIPAKAIWRR